MSAPYKKPANVEAIAATLTQHGFPEVIYLGRQNGQWPLHAWNGDMEKHVAAWILDDSRHDRTVVRIDIPKGIVEGVVAVEKTIERHLVVKS